MRSVLGSRASIGGVLGQGRGGAAASNGLLTGLVAYWGLDEASGNALDKHSGGLTLTQTASPGTDTGKVYSTVRTFDGASQYFSRAYDGALNTGAADFAIAAWVWMDNATNNRAILDKRGNNPGSGAAGFRGYLLAPQATSNIIRFYIASTTTGGTSATLDSGSVSSSAWHLVLAWRSTAENKIYLQIDNGTPAEQTALASMDIDSGAPFVVGYKSTTSATSITYFDGRIGPVAMWKNRTLSADDRSALWNGGAGLAYSAFTA